MYNRGMKRQSVAEARARYSDPLGAVEKSQSEDIERRRGRRKAIDYADDSHVAEGPWTSEWDGAGLDREPQPRK
jgi:hypothetical protein